jgi:hypothetical protein
MKGDGSTYLEIPPSTDVTLKLDFLNNSNIVKSSSSASFTLPYYEIKNGRKLTFDNDGQIDYFDSDIKKTKLTITDPTNLTTQEFSDVSYTYVQILEKNIYDSYITSLADNVPFTAAIYDKISLTVKGLQNNYTTSNDTNITVELYQNGINFPIITLAKTIQSIVDNTILFTDVHFTSDSGFFHIKIKSNYIDITNMISTSSAYFHLVNYTEISLNKTGDIIDYSHNFYKTIKLICDDITVISEGTNIGNLNSTFIGIKDINELDSNADTFLQLNNDYEMEGSKRVYIFKDVIFKSYRGKFQFVVINETKPISSWTIPNYTVTALPTDQLNSGIPEGLLKMILNRIHSNFRYTMTDAIPKDVISDNLFRKNIYYDEDESSDNNVNEYNEFNSRGVGRLVENNNFVKTEELTLKYYDDKDGEDPFIQWESDLSGVDILSGKSIIYKPRMARALPYDDIWTNIFAQHEFLKFTSHELRQIEAEMVSRLANINRRLRYVMPLVDLRRGYNLTMWGTDVSTFTQAGDYVGPTEGELSGAMGVATERENLGLQKRILELERFIWYFLAGKDVDGEDNWLYDKDADNPDYQRTLIGHNLGIEGTPGVLDPTVNITNQSLLGDSTFTLTKTDIGKEGSVLPRLKEAENVSWVEHIK